MQDDLLAKTAYHEAGHAYIGVLLGARVESLSIDPDWDDGPNRYGEAVLVWPARSFTNDELLQHEIRVALAGPVAEMVYTGETFHPSLMAEWTADWNTACTLAADLIADPQKRMHYLELTTRDLLRLINDSTHWAALSAVVDHLLAHEMMDGDEIAEILQQWHSG